MNHKIYAIDPREWKVPHDPEIYYQYTGHIWYPDTINKPFLKLGLDEMKKQYAEMRRMKILMGFEKE